MISAESWRGGEDCLQPHAADLRFELARCVFGDRVTVVLPDLLELTQRLLTLEVVGAESSACVRFAAAVGVDR